MKRDTMHESRFTFPESRFMVHDAQNTTMRRRRALAAVLGALLGATGLLAQSRSETAGRRAEHSLRGGVVDHIIVLVPARAPARFVGPELHLRVLRYTVEEAEADKDKPRVQGTMSFARKSGLQRNLRALWKEAREFKLVIYFLVEGERKQLRFQGVKVTQWEENFLQWTAARLEPPPKTTHPERREAVTGG
ncbi:MAG: hypothetical protein ACE5H2_06695 [Terriglobia bacterium]